MVDLAVGSGPRRQLGGRRGVRARASRGRGSGAHGGALAPAAWGSCSLQLGAPSAWGRAMDSAAGRAARADGGAEAASVSASNLSPWTPVTRVLLCAFSDSLLSPRRAAARALQLGPVRACRSSGWRRWRRSSRWWSSAGRAPPAAGVQGAQAGAELGPARGRSRRADCRARGRSGAGE
ncbi:hypothetical protein PVAP13_3KG264722 [Panicum virgatum]|uniref:Uncharacterized protein n=1 Tax=Panicum virgatum TaxID=38727 RepID=A0A8T0V0T6_PANVG|nr:hypothetical protein PVAP13_3KG264722 [Panicum virgatum]